MLSFLRLFLKYMINSTIKPKKKRCSCGCGNEGFIFSKGLLKECWFRLHGKPIKRVSDKRMANEFEDESLKNLEEDLVAIHSLYVRLKDANSDGITNCFVCETPIHYKNAQNSHYIDRIHRATRYDNNNCHPSCSYCNNLHNDNKEPYRQALERWKKGAVEYLEELKHTTYKFTKNELKSLIIEYRSKVDILKSKLK